MSRLRPPDSLTTEACPGYADACSATAWGDSVDTADAFHIEGCPRCTAAVAAARVLANACATLEEAPPARIRHSLADELLAATTLSAPEPGRRWTWAWGGGAAAVAAAGLAGISWWRLRTRIDDTPDFTETDLDLLEDLDLAENLDLLEVLDALEEIDDA